MQPSQRRLAILAHQLEPTDKSNDGRKYSERPQEPPSRRPPAGHRNPCASSAPAPPAPSPPCRLSEHDTLDRQLTRAGLAPGTTPEFEFAQTIRCFPPAKARACGTPPGGGGY